MWLGDDLLQNSFPRLLLNSENKGDGIGSYGKQVNGEWVVERLDLALVAVVIVH